MKTSESIKQRLQAEQQIQENLGAKLLEAQAELKAAGETQERVSYKALTKGDPKAMEQMELAEATKVKVEQRMTSIQAALAKAKAIQEKLAAELGEAVDEEAWNATVIDPYRREIATAKEIEKHFFGSDESVKPFVAMVKTHIQELQKIAGYLRNRRIEFNDPGMIFRRWMDCQLHPIFRDSNRMLYSPATREKFAGHYVPILTEQLQMLEQRRQQLKNQKAA